METLSTSSSSNVAASTTNGAYNIDMSRKVKHKTVRPATLKVPSDVLFYICTTNATQFKILFETLIILKEANLTFTKDGMQLKVFTPNQMTYLNINKAETYVYNYHEDSLNVGVNFKLMYETFKDVTQEDVACMFQTPDDYNHSVFTCETSNRDAGYVFSCKINMLNLNEEQFDDPEHEIDFSISLPAAFWKRTLNNLHHSAEYIQILGYMKDEIYKVFIHGVGAEKTTTVTIKGDVVATDRKSDIKLNKPYCSDQNVSSSSLTKLGEHYCSKRDLFPIKSLIDISSATAMSSYVDIHLAKNYPLILRYEVGPMGHLTFCVGYVVQTEETVTVGLRNLEPSIFNSDSGYTSGDGGNDGNDNNNNGDEKSQETTDVPAHQYKRRQNRVTSESSSAVARDSGNHDDSGPSLKKPKISNRFNVKATEQRIITDTTETGFVNENEYDEIDDDYGQDMDYD